MREKDLVLAAIEASMPNIEETRAKCLAQKFNMAKEKRTASFKRWTLSLATCAAVLVIAFQFPVVRAQAENIWRQLTGILAINGEQTELGSGGWLDLKPMQSFETTEYNGATYKGRAYADMAELENEVGYNFLEWQGKYSLVEDGLLYNIKNDNQGYVAALFDGSKYQDKVAPGTIYMFFALSPDAATGTITLEDQISQQQRYFGTFDEAKGEFVVAGLNETPTVATKYVLEEQYTSGNLGVEVSVVRENIEVLGDEQNAAAWNSYTAYFLYKDVEYQVLSHGTLEDIKTIVEMMK